jgi:dsRNA-specific ribonuclease
MKDYYNAIHFDEYIKVYLNISNDEFVNLDLTLVSKDVSDGYYIIKKIILDKHVDKLKESLNITNLHLDKTVLDIARTHPRYAKHHNRCLNEVCKLFYPNIKNIHMIESYNNGLSYIGSAIINFVCAVYLYNTMKSWSAKTEDYYEIHKIMTDKELLQDKVKKIGFNKYLAYNGGSLDPYSKKTKTVNSNLMRSLIGSMYESNPNKIPEVLNATIKLIIPDSKDIIDYTTYYKKGMFVGFILSIGLTLSIFIGVSIYLTV